jgi:signal transduction histidine kinase
MNKLLSQLKADTAPRTPRLLNPNRVVSEVAAEFAAGPVTVENHNEAGPCAVTIDPDRFRSALTHLVQNAVDASCPSDRVIISSHRLGMRLLIDITDKGPGMDNAFIRDELFLPFRSTKSGGYGIGAFQTRELIRISGGELEVISEKGFGTTMRIVLPLAGEKEQATSPAAT